jgi:hypothetical protein
VLVSSIFRELVNAIRRYGHQIAHLEEALALAQKALSTAAACDDNGIVVDVINVSCKSTIMKGLLLAS